MTLGLLAVAGLLGYLAAVSRLRRAGRRWRAARTAAAVSGAAVVAAGALLPDLWAAWSSGSATPVGWAGHGGHGDAVGAEGHAVGGHDDGHAAGAVPHMLQHVLLGMVAPVAVVLAAPVTLLLALSPLAVRPTLARLVRSRAAHVLGHPVLAAVPTVVGVHVLLLTPLLGASLGSPVLHGLVLAHTLLSGTWLAWALVGGDPAPARSSLTLRLVVLAVVAGTHAHLALLLYARASTLPPGVPWGVTEVERAAQVMYYAGDAAELLLAAAVVAVWYRAGGRTTARPPAPVHHLGVPSVGADPCPR